MFVLCLRHLALTLLAIGTLGAQLCEWLCENAVVRCISIRDIAFIFVRFLLDIKGSAATVDLIKLRYMKG